MIVSARVYCGVEMEVHFTLAARDALNLAPEARSLAGDQNSLLSFYAALSSAFIARDDTSFTTL